MIRMRAKPSGSFKFWQMPCKRGCYVAFTFEQLIPKEHITLRGPKIQFDALLTPLETKTSIIHNHVSVLYFLPFPRVIDVNSTELSQQNSKIND